jgi:hypothetical protein
MINLRKISDMCYDVDKNFNFGEQSIINLPKPEIQIENRRKF